MIVILLPLLVALLGLLMYALASGKLVEVGRILLWTGLLATLLHLSARVLQLP